MTGEAIAKRVEGLFGVKHCLTYKDVEFFIDVLSGLAGNNVDLFLVEGRPNLYRILLHQSEPGDEDARQVITWQYVYDQVDLVDGLIDEQSFVAKPLGPWIEQIDYFSSIGFGEKPAGVVPLFINLKHRRMQKVMKDVWNVYLLNRARAEALIAAE